MYKQFSALHIEPVPRRPILHEQVIHSADITEHTSPRGT